MQKQQRFSALLKRSRRRAQVASAFHYPLKDRSPGFLAERDSGSLEPRSRSSLLAPHVTRRTSLLIVLVPYRRSCAAHQLPGHVRFLVSLLLRQWPRRLAPERRGPPQKTTASLKVLHQPPRVCPRLFWELAGDRFGALALGHLAGNLDIGDTIGGKRDG